VQEHLALVVARDLLAMAKVRARVIGAEAAPALRHGSMLTRTRTVITAVLPDCPNGTSILEHHRLTRNG
jgi:hypothetical protein